MSQRLIGLSQDLSRLREAGYELSTSGGYLIVKHIPYVDAGRQIKYGTIVSELTLAGDITAAPADHVVYFAGDEPCDASGAPLRAIINSAETRQITSTLQVNYKLSSAPLEPYTNYFDKIDTYIKIFEGVARQIESSVRAASFAIVVDDEDDNSVFQYTDTASSRSETVVLSEKLEAQSIAIIGLGGTGSYVLDLISKTPVRAIHLYDEDQFLQHNAFRAPGAAAKSELQERLSKVAYFTRQYEKIHKRIVQHPYFIDQTNAGELAAMTFVFICIDNNEAKRPLIEFLEHDGIPFVDVGMGLEIVNGLLGGQLRTTLSTPAQRQHVHDRNRIGFVTPQDDGLYNHNIQVADLNALNAALAVVKWKKLCAYYRDLEREYFSTYVVDVNAIINEDRLE